MRGNFEGFLDVTESLPDEKRIYKDETKNEVLLFFYDLH